MDAQTTAPAELAAPAPSGNLPVRGRRSKGQVVGTVLFTLLLLGTIVVFVSPYLFTLLASFKPLNEILSGQPWDLPQAFSFTNYVQLFRDSGFGTYLMNTIMVTAIITVGQVFFSIMAAYAFARLKFAGRNALFAIYLGTMMVPNVVIIIPLYVIMNGLGLLDTYWALFLPYVFGTPYMIFLMRQFFMAIPEDIIAAARIDGCSELKILFRIILPMSKPIIATGVIIAFVFGWNNFMWPLIATNSDKLQVLTVAVANLSSLSGNPWNLILAGSLVSLIPLVVVFLIFRKYVVESISLAGANR